MVKNPPANTGDLGSVPGSRRSPAEENGYPVQYSCLEFHGQQNLAGYNPWGHKELDTTERLNNKSKSWGAGIFHMKVQKSQAPATG